MSTARDRRIDVLKGLGIFFVVAGHFSVPFTKWIFTFHMPLFFVVSGYLRYGAKNKDLKDFFLGKAHSSLLPYFIFWIISVLIYGNIRSLTVSGSFAPFGIDNIKGLLLGGHWLSDFSNNFPLWYLQHYFIASIVFELFVRFKNKYIKCAVFLISVLITLPVQRLLPGRPVFHINVLPAAIAFMFFGYFLGYIVKSEKVSAKLWKNIFVSALFLILGYVISTINYGNIANVKSYLYFPGAMCTIIGLFILSGMLGEPLAYLGRNTIYILGLHMLTMNAAYTVSTAIFNALNINSNGIYSICASIISIMLCCILAEIYKLIVRIIKRAA